MKKPKTYRLSEIVMERLETLKKRYPDTSETELVEIAINDLYIRTTAPLAPDQQGGTPPC